MTGDDAVMRQLSERIHRADIRAELLAIAARLRDELASSPDAKSTHASIPLDQYGAGLGEAIGSSWVFVLRANYEHPAERHPNSIQRMFALDSPGAMEVWENGAWRCRYLTPAAGDPGLSIPAYCWHRPSRLDSAWGVVSFHSVEPEELIEEIGDPISGETAASRHYLG